MNSKEISRSKQIRVRINVAIVKGDINKKKLKSAIDRLIHLNLGVKENLLTKLKLVGTPCLAKN